MKPPICLNCGTPIPELTLRSAFGRKGGVAGRGASKARSSEVMSKISRAYWDRVRKEKNEKTVPQAD